MSRGWIMLSLLIGCGAPGGIRSSAPPPTSETSASATPVPPKPSAPPVDSDASTRVEAGATLSDGTTVPLTPKIHPGDAELLGEKWVLYRDAQNALHARANAPSSQRLSPSGVTLSIGDRVKSGDWELQWIAVREGAPVVRTTHRQKQMDEWQAFLVRPIRAIASSTELEHLEVRLTASKGGPHLQGSTITIAGDAVEQAVSVPFGQSLKPGFYVFPDGLRMRVTQIANCDFDTSVPCFGGTYRAVAMKGAQEAKVDWRTKTSKVLGYTLTLANFEFSVRK